MRGRVLLGISLAGNILLGLWLWHADRTSSTPPVPVPSPNPEVVRVTNTVRTNVVVRRQLFSWSEVESPDYATFIRNLRGISCPEATIRDIIVADVNQTFARRRATEIPSPSHEWWKSDPDPETARSAADASQALERERRDLLTRLLGPGWEVVDALSQKTAGDTRLDGPLLGDLAPSVKAAIHEAERQSEQRIRTYREERERASQPVDPAVLAGLEQELRSALSQVLAPAQLEEYLLRYSDSAVDLRQQLRGVDLKPDEFRSLWRSVDSLDRDILAAGSDTSKESAERLAALELQRRTVVQETLGEERYAQYQLQQDPLYREVQNVAQEAGLSEDRLVPLAAIMRLTRDEEDRIRNDILLTNEERLEQLQAAREAQRSALRQLLGDAAFERYVASQPILEKKPQ